MKNPMNRVSRSLILAALLGGSLATTPALARPDRAAAAPAMTVPAFAMPSTELLQSQLTQQGFGALLGAEPKRRHVAAYTTRNGVPAVAKLGFDGTYFGYSIPRHARFTMPEAPAQDPLAAARAAGYANAQLAGYGKDTVRVMATNAAGQPVSLRIDAAGRIVGERVHTAWAGGMPIQGEPPRPPRR